MPCACVSSCLGASVSIIYFLGAVTVNQANIRAVFPLHKVSSVSMIDRWQDASNSLQRLEIHSDLNDKTMVVPVGSLNDVYYRVRIQCLL